MTRIGTNSPSSPLPRPLAAGGQEGPTSAPEPRAAGDRFSSQPLQPDTARSMIEADLRFSAVGGTDVRADGKVTLRHQLIERLVPFALKDCREIREPQVRFDPATREYRLNATYVFKGLHVPFSAAVHPMVQGNRFGFQLDQAGLKAGSAQIDLTAFRKQIGQTLAKTLARAGFGTTAQGTPGFVGLDINNTMRQIGAVPYYIRLDTDHTKLSAATDPKGNVVLGFTSDQKGVPVEATSRSDVSLVADDKALCELLSNLVGPDLLVKGLSFKDNQAVLHGEADAKPVSETLTAFKALFLLAALSSGQSPAGMDGSAVTVRVPLNIAARMEGHDVVVTPDMDRALPEIASALKSAGIAFTQAGKSLRVDTDKLAELASSKFERLEFTPQGLVASAHVDLDQLIGNPALVAPAAAD